MIRILIADDHDITRAGLRFFIANRMAHAVIDEAWDGDSTLEKVRSFDYALIILDVRMPGSDSFELLAKILNSRPEAKVLMFSMYPEYAFAKRYLQMGAKGYLSKEAQPEEIENAIAAVLNDERYMSPSLKQSIGEEIIGNKINPFDSLSTREFEIVHQLLKGATSAEIQQVLNLKPSTVGTYKARIFEKLGCKNIMDLITLAKMYNVLS